MTESPAAKFDDAARIFEEALRLAPNDRHAFLEKACRSDVALKKLVAELLQAQARQGEFLANPEGEHRGMRKPEPDVGAVDPPQAAPLVEGPGSRIGPYKLLQQIGEGGFGVVFMAEQEQPVRRRVAIKIIKLGMDTRQVVARFEQERQALALMDHPNIARVLDAGATESGRPYFVMELVRGVPITEYCDTNNLTTPERLEVFIPVCMAIQHAHQKGIIHRDLKPSNVLVTLHDGKPVAKIIDFGIAKATDRKLTEKTLFTELHAMVGTPAYMSPEQAEMTGLDVDTRSDVYSLGVLLYELLTSTTPFREADLRAAGYAEMQRLIREVEPPKPSTRVSTLGASLSAVAARRKIEPVRLGLLLRGDLDWIVMKALEKDRGRRYESAAGLADDVRRHTQGDPVIAAPPSMTYRARKFARKHKGVVTAGVTVLAALLVSLLMVSWSSVVASQQLATAHSEMQSLSAALEVRRAQVHDAERELATTEEKFSATMRLLTKAQSDVDASNAQAQAKSEITAGLDAAKKHVEEAGNLVHATREQLDVCQMCAGSGMVSGACPVCRGSGTCASCAGWEVWQLKSRCARCNGTRKCVRCLEGKVSSKCQACGGDGMGVKGFK